jgi:hypothetical protein
MGEATLDFAQIVVDQPYKFSTHLTPSISLTFPRYLCVVERFACLRITLLIALFSLSETIIAAQEYSCA